MPGVQRLRFFLSESPWEAGQADDRRLELLREEPATASHDGGVVVIDDSGDRKDGTATAHVGRQWPGRLSGTGHGIVTVTTVWTDGRVRHPLHAAPSTPAHHFARGRSDPAFRTKPQPAAALAGRGKEAGFGCRAQVVDCVCSSERRLVPRTARGRSGPCGGTRTVSRYLGPGRPAAHPHRDAAHTLAWRDAGRPGDWTPVERHFRDGRSETWWAADARPGGYGPDSPCRLVVATTDPAGLPQEATSYLATSLPHPHAPHAATGPHPPAGLAGIARLHGLRPWAEQSYEQVKDEPGRADSQVRPDRAVRRQPRRGHLCDRRQSVLAQQRVHPDLARGPSPHQASSTCSSRSAPAGSTSKRAGGASSARPP
jgi:DDE superfamily endonuclease